MPFRVLLSIFTLLLLPAAASATPLTIAGFGDSITCFSGAGCKNASYLPLLADFMDPDPITLDHGVSADTTTGVRARLDTWLSGGGSADWVVLLTGTPDTYQVTGGFGNKEYDENLAVSNVVHMVNAVLGAGIELLLAAPPPVVNGFCANPDPPLTCPQIRGRLDALGDRYQNVAANLSVPFIDLFDIFLDAPGNVAIQFIGDGLHPEQTTGQTLIAESVANAIAAQMAIPEPSTVLLVVPGLAALSIARRRARRP